jgi:hypothetical protein
MGRHKKNRGGMGRRKKDNRQEKQLEGVIISRPPSQHPNSGAMFPIEPMFLHPDQYKEMMNRSQPTIFYPTFVHPDQINSMMMMKTNNPQPTPVFDYPYSYNDSNDIMMMTMTMDPNQHPTVFHCPHDSSNNMAGPNQPAVAFIRYGSGYGGVYHPTGPSPTMNMGGNPHPHPMSTMYKDQNTMTGSFDHHHGHYPHRQSTMYDGNNEEREPPVEDTAVTLQQMMNIVQQLTDQLKNVEGELETEKELNKKRFKEQKGSN